MRTCTRLQTSMQKSVLPMFMFILLFCDEALRFEGSHTPAPRARDRLTVDLVLHITCGKHTTDVRLRCPGYRLDVTVRIALELSANEFRGGLVANRIEQAVDGQVPDLVVRCMLDPERVEQVTVTETFGRHSVPEDLDFGVVLQALCHDLARTQLVATYEDIDFAGVLGQVDGLLCGAIASADDRERFVAEDRDGAVAHCARRDAALPINLFAWQPEALGASARCDDDSVGALEQFLIFGVLAPVLEGTRAEVDATDGLGDDLSTETDRLCAELVHHVRAHDALREAGEVFDWWQRRE